MWFVSVKASKPLLYGWDDGMRKHCTNLHILERAMQACRYIPECSKTFSRHLHVFQRSPRPTAGKVLQMRPLQYLDGSLSKCLKSVYVPKRALPAQILSFTILLTREKVASYAERTVRTGTLTLRAVGRLLKRGVRFKCQFLKGFILH